MIFNTNQIKKNVRITHFLTLKKKKKKKKTHFNDASEHENEFH